MTAAVMDSRRVGGGSACPTGRQLPVRYSPRPLRALARTPIARQLADRAFAVGCCAFVAADLRLLDLVHQIAPLSTGVLP